METAAEKLSNRRLEEALEPETEALKAVLKAESESRVTQVQVTRNRGSFGGGAQGLRERQDLRNLF